MPPRVRVYGAILACAFGSFFMSPGHAQQQPAAARYEFSIAAMPLEEALQQLARQSGVQILFLSSVAQGRSAPDLSGKYSLTDAIERLLSGSGLTYRVINERTVEVRPAPPQPDSGTRTARSSASADEPIAEVRITAEQLVATRVPTALQEIPQSISVVSQERMRLQNDAELLDVLGHATGMVVNARSSVGGQIYARGYRAISLHIDGGAALGVSIPEPLSLENTPDLSGYESVEILRGSNALFAGNSNPGVTVSLQRKRPLRDYKASASVIAGSWNRYRAEADVTGPLARDGALRARAVALYSRNDFFHDFSDAERKKISGSLEYDVLAEGTFTLGGSYLWDDATPWEGGIPFFEDGSDVRLPRTRAHVPRWAFSRTRIGEAYLQYRQLLADNWNLRFNIAAWRPELAYAYAVHLSPVSSRTRRLGAPTAIFTGRPGVFRQVTTDATLTGKFDWFGKRQEVAIGGDWMRVRGTWDNFNAFLSVRTNLSDPFNPDAYPDPRLSTSTAFENDAVATRKLRGGFASMRFHLNDSWSVTGGARIGSNRLVTDSRFIRNGVVLNESRFDDERSNVITPYAGILYRIDDRFSAYASYADIYRGDAPTERASGGYLGPVHGVTIELGVKGAWREGALNGSFALYRTRQNNVAVFDEEAGFNVGGPDCCYLASNNRSAGAEIGIDGEAAPGWQVGAGYAYNVNRFDTRQADPLHGPRHSLKLWSNWRLPGRFSQWSVGGTLEAMSRIVAQGSFAGDGDPDVEIDPHAILGVRAGYEISRNLQLALSVNNILDKTYYQSVDPYYLRAWYGEPRNFAVRIDASF